MSYSDFKNRGFYSIKEFAQIVGVHPNTVRNCIKSGRISSFRLNNGKNAAYRIPSSEIDRLVKYNLDLVLKD